MIEQVPASESGEGDAFPDPSGWRGVGYLAALLLVATLILVSLPNPVTSCGHSPSSRIRSRLGFIAIAQETFRLDRKIGAHRYARSMEELLKHGMLERGRRRWSVPVAYRTQAVDGGFTVTAVPGPDARSEFAYFRDREGTLRHDLRSRPIGPDSPRFEGPQPARIVWHRRWKAFREWAGILLAWGLGAAVVALILHGFLRFVLVGLSLLPTRDLPGAARPVCEELGFERKVINFHEHWRGTHRGREVRVVSRPDQLRIEAKTDSPGSWRLDLVRRGPVELSRIAEDGPFEGRFRLAARPSAAEKVLCERDTAGQCMEAGRTIRLRRGIVRLEGRRPVSSDLVRIWIETVVHLADRLETESRVRR